VHGNHNNKNEKKRPERRKHCARDGSNTARLPAVIKTQTGPITIHCAAAS